MAYGVLPSLLNRAATGPVIREAQRQLAVWTLQPVAELLADEASAKLGATVEIDTLRPLQAFDAGGRARALSAIVRTLAEAQGSGYPARRPGRRDAPGGLEGIGRSCLGFQHWNLRPKRSRQSASGQTPTARGLVYGRRGVAPVCWQPAGRCSHSRDRACIISRPWSVRASFSYGDPAHAISVQHLPCRAG